MRNLLLFSIIFYLSTNLSHAVTCVNAIDITTIPSLSVGLTCSGSNDLTNANTATAGSGTLNGLKGGREALYTFTPSITEEYSISLTKSGTGTFAIFVYQGCPTSGGTFVAAASGTQPGVNLKTYLTAGTQYYIWFDRSGTGSICPGTFSVEVVLHDECSTMGDLSKLNSPLTVNTTDGADDFAICGGVTSPDLMYSIVVPTGATFNYQISNYNYDAAFQLVKYDPGCVFTNSDSNFIYCGDYSAPGPYSWTNTSGTDQQISWIIDGLGLPSVNSSVDLTWSLVLPPPCAPAATNDLCANAVALSTNTDYTVDHTCATATAGPNAPSCVPLGETINDIWYTLTPSVSGNHTLILSPGTATNYGLAVYTGSCASLTYAGLCIDGDNNATANLTSGTTYYLRVYNTNTGAGSTGLRIQKGVPQCSANAVYPTNGGTTCPLVSTTFQWAASIGTTSYDIYLSTDSAKVVNSDPTVKLLDNFVSTSYLYSLPLSVGNWFWKVVPANTDGQATGCSTWKFAVLPVPVGSTMANAIVVNGNNYTTTGSNAPALCYAEDFGNASHDVYYRISVPICRDSVVISTVGGGTNFDSYVYLLDSTGTILGFDNDFSGNQARLTVGGLSAGTYFVVVEGNGSASGNYQLSIDITDNSPMVISACPANISKSIPTGSCLTTATWTPPVVTQNCPFSYGSNILPGADFGRGTTVVTYSATDASGANVSCSFNVAVSGGCNLWRGVTSTNWSVGSNWSAGTVPNCSDNAYIQPATNLPVVSVNASARDLTIAAGAAVNVSTGRTLQLCGNLANYGQQNMGMGTITASGSKKTITGTISFENLNITGSITSAQSALFIRNELRISGTFNPASSTNLNFLGVPGKNPYLFITGAGKFTAINSNVSHNIPSSGTIGSRLLSAPPAVSLSSFADDIPIVGNNGVNGVTPYHTGVWPNVWRYSEPYAGTSSSAGYFSFTNLGKFLQRGEGYSFRYSGAMVNLDVYNVILKTGNFSKTITYTNNGNTEDGKNLMGNPYLCPINFNQLWSVNSSLIEPTVYFYSPTGEYSGNFVTWNAQTSVGTGTSSGIIAPFQGYFVKAKSSMGSSASLLFNNSMLVPTSSTAFYKTEPTNHSLVRLQLKGASVEDEMVVLLHEQGNNGYDANTDSRKFFPAEQEASSLYSYAEGHPLAINTLSQTNGLQSAVPVGLTIVSQGTYQVVMTENSLPAGTTVFLKDRKEQKTYDLSRVQPAFGFSPSDDLNNRFFLVFENDETARLNTDYTNIYLSNDKVVVDFGVAEGVDARISITNILGQQIADIRHQQDTRFEFPVGNTPKAVWIVKVEQAGVVKTQKLIVGN